MSTQTALLSALILLLMASLAPAAPVATKLQAEYRDGQVFLTWDEPGGLQGYLTVVTSAQPITADNIKQARVVAHHINPGSAYDWWLNPETYGNPLAKDPNTGEKPPIPHEGFLIRAGGSRLNPDSGLHVHTVTPDEVGPRYYAVVSVGAAGVENWEVTPGANSLAQAVSQKVEPVQPIWQGPGNPPDPATGQGLPVHLYLHAKTGQGGQEWLLFGDKSLGWREGLPCKFGVYVDKTAVRLVPTDRTWIGRLFTEGRDDCQRLTPAIHSFWYGYNSNIYDRAQMQQGVVVNYTEQRLIWLLDWTRRTYGTDPNRVYGFGSSMGACGMISFALRHPEIFAGIRAHVPIVAFDKGAGGDSEMRVVEECGGMEAPTEAGLTVRQRLDATRFVRETPGDLPFLVITNGRQDGSIPWWKCPDFYRAMRDGKHGFVAAWDDGTHATCQAGAPPDIKAWSSLDAFHHLALNKSYLAFANSSQDGNPGAGERKDGDIVGYMNRGLSWLEPVDQADRYRVVIKWNLEAGLPVTVDVTPRRLQAFRIKPGQKVVATNVEVDTGREVQRLTLEGSASGLVTFGSFQVTSAKGNRLELR